MAAERDRRGKRQRPPLPKSCSVLFLPSAPSFRLEVEIKSVVTVVAQETYPPLLPATIWRHRAG